MNATTSAPALDAKARRRQRDLDRRDGLVSLSGVTLDVTPLTEIIDRIGGVGAAFDRLEDRKRASLRRTYYRALETGEITAASADDLAIALGRNPVEVWGQAWWEVA